MLNDAIYDVKTSAFWHMYRNYELDLNKLGDTRLTLIKDYADNYETMTDAKATERMDKAFKFLEKRLKLQKKYFQDNISRQSNQMDAIGKSGRLADRLAISPGAAIDGDAGRHRAIRR